MNGISAIKSLKKMNKIKSMKWYKSFDPCLNFLLLQDNPRRDSALSTASTEKEQDKISRLNKIEKLVSGKYNLIFAYLDLSPKLLYSK